MNNQASNQQSYLKLHNLSPLFMLLDTIKEFFVLILFALFASTRAESWQMWGIGISCVFVLFRMIGIRFFKYCIAKDELIVKQGILFRQERHIPFERIQNINETQGLLHRWFKVSKVVLESASGVKPEAVFNVVSHAALDDIRLAVAQHDKNYVDVSLQFGDTPAEKTSLSEHKDQLRLMLFMPVGEVIKHGLITLQGLIPIAIVFGLLAQAEGLWDKVFTPLVEMSPGVANISRDALANAPGLLIASVFALGLFAVIAFCTLSVFYSLLRFYNFTLSRDADKLLAVKGLITQQSSSTSLPRIQKITLGQNILHRVFKRITVSCKTAGNAAGKADGVAKFNLLAPLSTHAEAKELLADLFTQFDWSFLESTHKQWVFIPYRSWRRLVKWDLFFWMGVLAIAAIWLKFWVFALAVPIIIWSVVDAQQTTESTAYLLHDDFIVYKSGWISKYLSFVPIQKGQAVTLKQNRFDLRHEMASFDLDTAGVGFFEHDISIRYLDYEDASELHQKILKRTNALEFEW